MSQRTDKALDDSSQPSQHARNKGKAIRKSLWNLVSNPFSNEELITNPDQPGIDAFKPTKGDKVESKQVNYLDSSKFEGENVTPTHFPSNLASYRQSPIPGSYPSPSSSPVMEHTELIENTEGSFLDSPSATESNFRNFPTFVSIPNASSSRVATKEINQSMSGTVAQEKSQSRRSSAGFFKGKLPLSKRKSTAKTTAYSPIQQESTSTRTMPNPASASSPKVPARPAGSLRMPGINLKEQDDNGSSSKNVDKTSSLSTTDKSLGTHHPSEINAIEYEGDLFPESTNLNELDNHKATAIANYSNEISQKANNSLKNLNIGGGIGPDTATEEDNQMSKLTHQETQKKLTMEEQVTARSESNTYFQGIEHELDEPSIHQRPGDDKTEYTSRDVLTSNMNLPTFTSPEVGSISAWEEVMENSRVHDFSKNSFETSIPQHHDVIEPVSEMVDKDTDIVKSISTHGPISDKSDHFRSAQRSSQDTDVSFISHRLTTDISPIFGQSKVVERDTLNPGIDTLHVQGDNSDDVTPLTTYSDQYPIDRAVSLSAESQLPEPCLNIGTQGLSDGMIMRAATVSLHSDYLDKVLPHPVKLLEGGIISNTVESVKSELNDFTKANEIESESDANKSMTELFGGAAIGGGIGTIFSRKQKNEKAEDAATANSSSKQIDVLLYPSSRLLEADAISPSVKPIKSELVCLNRTDDENAKSTVDKGVSGILRGTAIGAGLLGATRKSSTDKIVEAATSSLNSNQIDEVVHPSEQPSKDNVIAHTVESVKSEWRNLTTTGDDNVASSTDSRITEVLGGSAIGASIGGLFGMTRKSSTDKMIEEAATSSLNSNQIDKVIHLSEQPSKDNR
ncbi:hypothetical protein K7432_016467 [Basidiobolus ranarum]|uniref:Uncharacterized protein n=1 Tax=Basidiobolus ranarum TaxID=34480 RepID=A0ABR2VLL2_9FUNG